MNVVTTFEDLRQVLAGRPKPVGFVPTMGYLHDGHISLVHRARTECRTVIASIFVNPTQFGPTEDLSTYPRDLPRDLALLEQAGADLVWTPTAEAMYPPGFQTWVDVEGLSQHLEGAQRPGHFRGVTTVVAKLFNAVQPDKAYFGQKDAQQAAVILRMVADLNYPLEVVVCPIVREPDGLAMSSRNTYLDPEQRRAATVLYRALTTAVQAYQAGEIDTQQLRALMAKIIDNEPLARRQYVSCADPTTLVEIDGPVENALLSMAVFIGRTRLIDNMLIPPQD
jgi:pantoate--beta-alanine ligase